MENIFWTSVNGLLLVSLLAVLSTNDMVPHKKKKNSDDDTKTTIWEIDHNTPCKLIYSSTTSFHLLTAWRKKDRNKESLGDSDDGDDNNNNKISNKRNHRLPFTKGSITIPCMLHFHVNNSIITISYNPHVDNID